MRFYYCSIESRHNDPSNQDWINIPMDESQKRAVRFEYRMMRMRDKQLAEMFKILCGDDISLFFDDKRRRANAVESIRRLLCIGCDYSNVTFNDNQTPF